MKKQIFALVFTLILLFTIITVSNFSASKAEPDYTSMQIISPRSTVYHNSSIDIFVVVHKLVDAPYPLITKIKYSLNASNIFTYDYANFTYNGLVDFSNNKSVHEYVGKATLEGLKEGNYSLRVMYGQGNDTIGSWSGSSVSFRVMYEDYEPAILKSPTNQTYYSPNVPLVFSTNEDYIYAYYSLNDGKPIFGIFIHNLKCPRNGTSFKGTNPFDTFNFTDGRKLSSVVNCYDPSSSDTYNDIAKNMESWVNAAIAQRK
jgi:hypothetical protein